MGEFILEVCSLACAGAATAGCLQRARRQANWAASLPLVAGFAALAVWMLSAAVYVRSPFSPFRGGVMLAMLCLAHAPWMLVALAMREPESGLPAVSQRWKGLLATQLTASGVAAFAMGFRGVDWAAGIGSEPVLVLTNLGLAALALAVMPPFAGLAILATQARSLMAKMPILFLGAAGATGSLLWVSAAVLQRGYLTLTALLAAVALGGTAAVVWTIGVIREVPGGRSLAPSRRLVYGACAAGLGLAYFLIVGALFRWVSRLAGSVPSWIVPAAGFAAAAGLVILVASRRSRHRLWVAVGRLLFGSKHDYGEVWVRLTEIIGAARNAPGLARRTARFCRNVLGVHEVSVWLVDTAGHFWCAAVARDNGATSSPPADRQSMLPVESISGANGERDTSTWDEATLARAIGCSFACPLEVNGRLLGALAIGAQARPARLDTEDRRLVRHLSAQVASALGLFRLAQEIADAREVTSFHRLSAFVLHDLKNLVVQQSFVLENAKTFAADAAFVADALAAFEDSTERMRSLIGRLASGEPARKANAAACELIDLLREVIAVPKSAARNCVPRLIVPDGVSACRVPADRSGLAQAFRNLLANAMDSLPPEGGKVTVEIKPGAHDWHVRVRDNGSGIPADFIRDHLFRPFRSTKNGGLGIGLYQCKSTVEAVGGTIAVRSKERGGTTVEIVLPAATTSGEEDPSGKLQNGKAYAPTR